MMDYVIIDGNVIGTIVAVTQEDHTRGLMGKAWPPPIMAFPYKTAEVRKFWMKSTPSPLDIIFCRSNRVVGIFTGKPYDEFHLGPDEPTDLVVEMPSGMAKALNIMVGASVLLKPSIYTVAASYGEFLMNK